MLKFFRDGHRVIIKWWLTAGEKDIAIFLRIPSAVVDYIAIEHPSCRRVEQQVVFSSGQTQPGVETKLSHACLLYEIQLQILIYYQ